MKNKRRRILMEFQTRVKIRYKYPITTAKILIKRLKNVRI